VSGLPAQELRLQAHEDGIQLVFGVEQLWEELLAEVLVLVVQALEDQQAGNVDEEVVVPALDLLLELFVFLARGLDNVGEVDERGRNFDVEKVVLAHLPALLVFDEQLDQVLVVLELRVDHFDVFLVDPEQLPQLGE